MSSGFVAFGFLVSCQVENNECGLPCFGTKMESEPLPHLRSKCLLLKQDEELDVLDLQ